MPEDVPVVILAGGLGLRMRDYSNKIPKALVPIGRMAVIIHVMKIYKHYGHNNFIVLGGYMSDQIDRYLGSYNKSLRGRDRLDYRVVNTGLETQTGGRIKKIEKEIDGEDFFATYCDGLSDVNIGGLYRFHKKMGKVATMTVVHPMSPFGIVGLRNGLIKSFKEKPVLPGLINGGFFVFNRRIFGYLEEKSVLEEEVMKELTEDGELAGYEHKGFWTCMDTFKDVDRLNKLWTTGHMPNMDVKVGKIPWKVWSG